MVENATSITKKLIIRPIRSAKVTNQPCPPPCASPRFFLAMVDYPPIPAELSVSLFALGVAMFFRQVGQKHFTDQRRALGIPDHQNAVDDQRAVGFLVEQLDVKLVGDRQTEQLGDKRAVQGRQ